MSLICIYIGGIMSLLGAIFHTQFYKQLGWEEEFQKVSPLNQRVFYTINVALYLLFFLFGSISIIYAEELSQCNGLAFGLVLLYSLFWLWRLVWQFTYFQSYFRKIGEKIPAIDYVLVVFLIITFLAYFTPVFLKII